MLVGEELAELLSKRAVVVHWPEEAGGFDFADGVKGFTHENGRPEFKFAS